MGNNLLLGMYSSVLELKHLHKIRFLQILYKRNFCLNKFNPKINLKFEFNMITDFLKSKLHKI